MQLRRVFVIALFACGLLGAHAAADAGRSKSSNKGKTKICTTKKGKRSCRWEAVFQGHGVSRDSLRSDPLDRPSGDIWVKSENVHDEIRLNIYGADGTFDDSSLARLDEVFRCRRSGEVRAVDPHLYEMLSRIYDHFGQKRIELVSGFRFEERDSSRHFHASAMDIRIPGVSIKEMYEFAQSLDCGGMGIGIYPTSGFVHVDFRAPGDPSYRWTDRSGPGDGKRDRSRDKRPGRTVSAKKPTS